MKLKRIVSKKSQINERVYYGEALTDSEVHIVFIVTTCIEDDIRVSEVIRIMDIDGNDINDISIETELLRGF